MPESMHNFASLRKGCARYGHQEGRWRAEGWAGYRWVPAGSAWQEPMARSRTEAKQRQGQRTDIHGGKFPQGEPGKTRDKVAAVTGVSGRTYEKAKQVVEAAERNPEASQRKIAGVLGVHSSTVDRDLNAGVAANAAPADVEAPKTAAVESLLAANAAPAPSPANLSGADAALLVAKKTSATATLTARHGPHQSRGSPGVQ